MTKVHIVIPVHNNWAMTHNQLWQLYKHEQGNIDTVLVVNDQSTDETMSGLEWWVGNNINLKVNAIHLEENIGFLLASNLGLETLQEMDKDDIVILLSNDVLIHGKFIQQIKDLFVGNSHRLAGGILLSHDTGWNKFGERIFPYLEGWVLATTVGTWKALGFFDGRYAPSDFEDVDISTTARSMGYELVPLNNPALQHMGGQTIGYNETRLKRTNENKKKFGDKWIK